MLQTGSNQNDSAAPEALSRVLVTGIGAASPAAAAAIAKGLGLPPEKVVSCLYKAPSVLVDAIPAPTAAKLCSILEGTGLTAECEPQEAPLPSAGPLYDIALFVRSAIELPDIASVVADFLGIDEGRAMEMLFTPPGLILGEVSQATVDALRHRLVDRGVDVIASRPIEALYDLFVTDAAPVVLSALKRDLDGRGIDVLGDRGLVATGLDYETGRTLWRRHQASGAVRLINREFERFDLNLRGVMAEADPGALTELAGIPDDMIEDVLADLPITLEEGLSHAEIADQLLRYAQAGLIVDAEMTSFQHLGLDIVATDDPAETAAALSAVGLLAPDARLPALPFRTAGTMPELQARMSRAILEQAGATVYFAEASA